MSNIIVTISETVIIRSIVKIEDKLELYKIVYKFAYSRDGMNKNSDSAELFANNWIKHWINYDFREFAIAYLFAYSSHGMNKSSDSAEKFAYKWLQKACGKDIEAFANWYLFAYSSSGMNKSSDIAEEFAFNKIL